MPWPYYIKNKVSYVISQQCSSLDLPVVASELLIISLDLVKNRVVVMSMEMRKSFIGQILVGLIEKTPDSKVMKAITKMVEDWVKTKVGSLTSVFLIFKVSKNKRKSCYLRCRNIYRVRLKKKEFRLVNIYFPFFLSHFSYIGCMTIFPGYDCIEPVSIYQREGHTAGETDGAYRETIQ